MLFIRCFFVVSNGWSNIKHEPLFSVLAVNSRGSMYMYAIDFSRVEKTCKAIVDFLGNAIDSVEPK